MQEFSIVALCGLVAHACSQGDGYGPLYQPMQEQWALGSPSQGGEPTTMGILTNIMGAGAAHPEIRIIAPNKTTMWKWNVENDLKTTLPDSIRTCIRSGTSVTDVKQSESGNLIAAIYGDAVIVLKHSPNKTLEDKEVVWAICANDELLRHSHALELLPDDLIAIATSGQSQSDGIAVYNMSTALGFDNTQSPIQTISHLPDVHALVWEKATGMLWAAGTNASIDDTDPASGRINGYLYQKYSHDEKPLDDQPLYGWSMPNAATTYTEWRGYHPYQDEWDAPHDLILVPGQRVFIIPTDLDVHALNISSGKFVHGQDVIDEYLAGFVSVDSRVGINKLGHEEELPHSDLKSISFGQESTIYVQAKWKTFFADMINILSQGKRQTVHLQGEFYRARWFKV